MSADIIPKRDYMADAKIQWRHAKPDYTLVNNKYMKEKQNKHAADSLEKVVENLVKTWEMESSHKVREEDWGSIDPEKFTINSNGGHKFSLKDNIERGNYNMLLDDCILWRPETNQESHDMFRGALPGGFAWELVELTSGPPVVSFTWRHWGTWEGKYKDVEPTGEEFELFGSCVVRVDDKLKIQSIEVYYDPNPMMAKLTGFDKTGVCPFTKAKK